MGSRSGHSRALTALVLSLHVAVAGWGPLVDARLEASERQTVVHVESESSKACAAGHDHLFCQVCRTISLAAGPAPSQWHAPEPAQQGRAVRGAARGVARLHALVAAHGPRAPPPSF